MCIAGILRPDEGCIVLNNRVLFDSESVSTCRLSSGAWAICSGTRAVPNMTVNNIACGLCREKAIIAQASGYHFAHALTELEKHHRTSFRAGNSNAWHWRAYWWGSRTAADELTLWTATQRPIGRGVPPAEVLRRGRAAGDPQPHRLISCAINTVMKKGGLGLVARGVSRPARAGAALTGCKNIVDARKVGTLHTCRTGALRGRGKPVGMVSSPSARAHHFGGDISRTFTIRA